MHSDYKALCFMLCMQVQCTGGVQNHFTYWTTKLGRLEWARKVPLSPLVVLGCCCMGGGEVAGQLWGKDVVVIEH